MGEVAPHPGLELVKLEAMREAVIAKRLVQLDWWSDSSAGDIEDCAEWMVYEGLEHEREWLEREVAWWEQNARYGLSSPRRILVGALLGDDDLMHQGIVDVKGRIAGEKLDELAGEPSLHVFNEEETLRALAAAGRADLITDFAMTRKHGLPAVAGMLLAAHLTGDESLTDAAEQALDRELERGQYSSYYPHQVREFSTAILSVSRPDLMYRVAQNQYLSSGDSAELMFDYLLRYGASEHGPYTLEQLLEEFAVFEKRPFRDELDPFVSQFHDAFAFAGGYRDDVISAEGYFGDGISAITDGYTCDYNGPDYRQRRSSLRSLMLQTLLLMNDTDAAYQLAGTPVLPSYYNLEDVVDYPLEQLQETIETFAQARMGWVLLRSMERSDTLRFEQLAEYHGMLLAGMEPQDTGTIIDEPPHLLRHLKLIDRAIEERQVVLEASS